MATTTGSGWVDPALSDSFEYLTGGDSAIVALQYSYLPSWISYLVDQSKAREAGRALFRSRACRHGRNTAEIPRHEHSIPWFWPFAAAIELGEAGLALFAENLKFVAEVAKLEYALEPTWATANRILRDLDTIKLRILRRDQHELVAEQVRTRRFLDQTLAGAVVHPVEIC